MKFRLFVVGKMTAELSAFESRFMKRLSGAPWSLEIIELAEGRGKQITQRKAEEEKTILKAVSANFILFDEQGKQRTSKQWSSHFQQLPANAVVDLVIGGAAGVSGKVRQQAAQVWSLSSLTLPHQMARVLIVEQLYRAYSISIGHPYHRE